MTGVRLVLEAAGAPARRCGRVLHGTTVATNLILEGKGARTALVTTAAFATCWRSAARTSRGARTCIAWVKPKRPVPPRASSR